MSHIIWNEIQVGPLTIQVSLLKCSTGR